MTTKGEPYFKRGGSGDVFFVLLALSSALFVALLALTSVLAPQARAQAAEQKAVGPTNPDNGFPFWYQDDTGIRLDLCLEQNGLCLTEEPDPTQPISFPDNFGGEAFWWAAEASTDNALLVLASEAAFANEEPVDGDQVAFGRIRIRVDNLTAGSDYRVTHPYGEEIYEDVPGGVRGINDTQDVGCFDVPCATFDRALQSPVFKGFLTWDTLGTEGPGAPPAGYIGDPAVEHAVTGSPTGNNFFRVERGEVNPAGVFVPDGTIHAESDQFSVMGKIAELSAVATPRGGEFDAPQQVTLTGSEPAGDIFYTLDGSDPSDENNAERVQYDGTPINIAQTSTLRYVVFNAEGEQSEIFEQRYVIVLPTDVSLDAGSALLNFRQDTGLSGRLVSNGEPLANKPVELLQRPFGDSGFSAVPNGQLTTDAQGNFSLDGVRPDKNTIYRAIFRGENEALRPSLSAPERVNVRAAVTLNVFKDQLSKGQRVGMGGVVRPNHEGFVRLQIFRGGQRIAVRTVSLGDNSRYRFVYRPPTIGNYAVRAVFPKQDADHVGNFSRPLERFKVNRP